MMSSTPGSRAEQAARAGKAVARRRPPSYAAQAEYFLRGFTDETVSDRGRPGDAAAGGGGGGVVGQGTREHRGGRRGRAVRRRARVLPRRRQGAGPRRRRPRPLEEPVGE